MCTMGQCKKHLGQWVQFQTPWGVHRGIVTDVNHRAVLVRVPKSYAPVRYATATAPENADERKLDVALAQWGGYGYAGRYGYPGRWGYPGYGAWFGGWWLWWLAFAWVFWLAFLW